jgi:hypothetical protein
MGCIVRCVFSMVLRMVLLRRRENWRTSRLQDTRLTLVALIRLLHGSVLEICCGTDEFDTGAQAIHSERVG